jgi:hypothetical protein
MFVFVDGERRQRGGVRYIKVALVKLQAKTVRTGILPPPPPPSQAPDFHGGGLVYRRVCVCALLV